MIGVTHNLFVDLKAIEQIHARQRRKRHCLPGHWKWHNNFSVDNIYS